LQHDDRERHRRSDEEPPDKHFHSGGHRILELHTSVQAAVLNGFGHVNGLNVV
jgi:hypothetical protein